MKIAIEGMDGVGKSTIAKRLAEKLNYTYLEKPLEDLFEIDKIPGSEILSKISKKIYAFDIEIIKAWFFGMGNIYSFLKYENDNLVIDRHFASNYFWNGNDNTNSIFKNMIDLIGTPDVTILLYASISTRLERIYKRDPKDYDLFDKEKHVDGYEKMIKFLNEFNIPFVLVNTENKTEDEVFDEVNNIVKKMSEKLYIKKMEK